MGVAKLVFNNFTQFSFPSREGVTKVSQKGAGRINVSDI